jgi:hypothetical protein
VTLFRPSLAGALTGAVVGAVGRVVVAGLHVYEISQTTIPGLLVVGVLGLTIGGLAGLTGRPLSGAIVGIVLSAIVYAATAPIALLFHALGAITPPSPVQVLAVGALAGALGGAAGRLASQKAERPRAHR